MTTQSHTQSPAESRPVARQFPQACLRLSSRQLRCLVRDALPMDYGKFEDEPFTESSHDDGMLWHLIDGSFDEFSVCVPLREFLSARFGVHQDAIFLEWSPYEWRYAARVYGAIITPAERQRLAEYED